MRESVALRCTLRWSPETMGSTGECALPERGACVNRLALIAAGSTAE